MGLISMIDSLQCLRGGQEPWASITMRHLHGQEVLKETFNQGMEIAGRELWVPGRGLAWRYLVRMERRIVAFAKS